MTADTLTDDSQEIVRPGPTGLHGESGAWVRFAFGECTITLVSDGALKLGDPRDWFLGLPHEAMDAVFRQHFLDPRSISLSENIMVVRSGGRTVMFDTGTGGAASLGATAGKLTQNLQRAGIDPAGVDDIVLSHGHPDHIFGLTDAAGSLAFPNAQVHVSEADYRYFSDEANAADPRIGAFIPDLRRVLLAVSDRLSMIRDGKDVVPGVTAIAAPGHTMGHMAFALSSGGRTLIQAADLAHHFAVFTRHPDAYFLSDMDPGLMARSRRRMLDMLATDRLPFAGYHFPFPGLGHIVRDRDAFAYVPAVLDPDNLVL